MSRVDLASELVIYLKTSESLGKLYLFTNSLFPGCGPVLCLIVKKKISFVFNTRLYECIMSVRDV